MIRIIVDLVRMVAVSTLYCFQVQIYARHIRRQLVLYHLLVRVDNLLLLLLMISNLLMQKLLLLKNLLLLNYSL